jgi:hypothetical protein
MIFQKSSYKKQGQQTNEETHEVCQLNPIDWILQSSLGGSLPNNNF